MRTRCRESIPLVVYRLNSMSVPMHKTTVRRNTNGLGTSDVNKRLVDESKCDRQRRVVVVARLSSDPQLYT